MATMRMASLLVAVVLAQYAAASSPAGLVQKQNDRVKRFSGTADDIEYYDPHNYVPLYYFTIIVVHGVLMSVAWLIIFPIGGIIPRIWTGSTSERLLTIHVSLQMFGFAIVIAAAGMGIWMAKEIDHLTHYHPVIGMILLCLLTIQPTTEILNHKFYRQHPKLIIGAHIHLWLGRGLLIAGVVQGGLGFLFSLSFRDADQALAPRVAYAGVALVVWFVYMCVGILYPEYRGSWRKKKSNQAETISAQEAQELEILRGNSVTTAYAGNGPGYAGSISGVASQYPASPQTGYGSQYAGSMHGGAGPMYAGSMRGGNGSPYSGMGPHRAY